MADTVLRNAFYDRLLAVARADDVLGWTSDNEAMAFSEGIRAAMQHPEWAQAMARLEQQAWQEEWGVESARGNEIDLLVERLPVVELDKEQQDHA